MDPFIEVLLNVFLEVVSGVCSLIGLNGSCSFANQSKGISKEAFVRTSVNEANNQAVEEYLEKDDAASWKDIIEKELKKAHAAATSRLSRGFSIAPIRPRKVRYSELA